VKRAGRRRDSLADVVQTVRHHRSGRALVGDEDTDEKKRPYQIVGEYAGGH
jgi:hypothetical protein